MKASCANPRWYGGRHDGPRDKSLRKRDAWEGVKTVLDHLAMFQIGLYFNQWWNVTPPQPPKELSDKIKKPHYFTQRWWQFLITDAPPSRGWPTAKRADALTKWGHVAQRIGLHRCPWHCTMLEGQSFFNNISQRGNPLLKKSTLKYHIVSHPIISGVCIQTGKNAECSF